MTEQEWLECTDAQKMVNYLWENASTSKFRFLLAAVKARQAIRGNNFDPVVLVRCIFGNPFRPITIFPAVLAWNDSLVARLAQATYEECDLPDGTLDNGLLAILADALEEAGCTDTDILGHLRGPDPHVRGCWPVDLCLGKD